MHTLEVTREFLAKCDELAKIAKVPEVKARLTRLADDYRRKVEELERIESESIAPAQRPQPMLSVSTQPGSQGRK